MALRWWGSPLFVSLLTTVNKNDLPASSAPPDFLIVSVAVILNVASPSVVGVLRAHHLCIRVVIQIECHGNASLPLHSSLNFEYSIIEWELQGLERKMKTA